MIKKYTLRLLESIYGLTPFYCRNIILYIIKKIDGEEFWSPSLRRVFFEHYKIEVGIGSYGCFNPNKFPCGTKIGNYCSIAPNVIVFNGNHPMDFVSTHPIFYNPNLGYVSSEKIRRNKLVIGHDVWIGYGSLILPSVNFIGDGAVIGAGSIVTKDIEPYNVVAGNPAKVIKRRFSQETAEAILQSKWYLRDPSFLGSYIDFADDPIEFILKINTKE